jgi:hypothetical protein
MTLVIKGSGLGNKENGPSRVLYNSIISRKLKFEIYSGLILVIQRKIKYIGGMKSQRLG